MTVRRALHLFFGVFLLHDARAFVSNNPRRQYASSTSTTSSRQPLALRSFWRQWIPETDFMSMLDDEKERGNNNHQDPREQPAATSPENPIAPLLQTTLATALLFLVVAIPQAGVAVSGGGLDFAGTDISGQDFSNSANYKGKDFTQVIAKGTKFSKSNLQGCRFYKAYLVNTDFSDADIRGVSMEDTSMDGANLKNAVASGAYFSASIVDTASVENADFTDAQFPVKSLPLLCDRPDMKGKNPVTGVDTRDSAMCP